MNAVWIAILFSIMASGCGVKNTPVENPETKWETIPEAEQAVLSEEHQSISDENSSDVSDIISSSEPSINEDETSSNDPAADAYSDLEEIKLLDAPMTFYYASGAGAWGSEITINPDWTFYGSFHDTDAGAEGGPQRKQCDYTGRFVDIKHVDEYSWSLRIESITPDRPIGETWMEGDVRCTVASPYGITENTTYMIYVPGADNDILPSTYVGALFRPEGPLIQYSLYNPEGEAIFWGFE